MCMQLELREQQASIHMHAHAARLQVELCVHGCVHWPITHTNQAACACVCQPMVQWQIGHGLVGGHDYSLNVLGWSTNIIIKLT